MENAIVADKPQTLFDLVNQFNEVMAFIADNGGELTPEQEAQLLTLDLETGAKLDGYKFFIDKLGAESEFWKAEAARRAKIAKSCEGLAAIMKNRIKDGIIAMGKDELVGESIRAKISSTKGSLKIDDATKIPDSYKLQVMTVQLDTERIRAELDLAGHVPGARIEGGTSIRFYPVSAAQLKAANKKVKAVASV